MTPLTELKCVHCNASTPKLSVEEIATKLFEIDDWLHSKEEDKDTLARVFTFENFDQALSFTIQLGKLAESENHHPAILTEWGKVKVWWWTHSINGLHNNDFIMAAKTDQLFKTIHHIEHPTNKPLKR
ncbi:4a-hydroxytetrahydrobiopterin dehydratase [Aurantivibrio infirmus]